MASPAVALTDEQMLKLLNQGQAQAPVQGSQQPAGVPPVEAKIGTPQGGLTDEQMLALVNVPNAPKTGTSGKAEAKPAPTSIGPKSGAPGLPDGVTEWKGAGGQRLRMHSDLTDPFMQADQEFFKATGEHIKVNSSFRTTAEQQKLYDKLHPKGAAVAKPGHSRHEKGRALDIQNWEEAEPYLRKYGLLNDIKGDKNHFQLSDDYPSAGQNIAKAVAPYSKTVLPAVGFTAGSIAGGAAGGTAGSVVPFAGTAAGASGGAMVGGGLGYAAANQAQRAIEEYAQGGDVPKPDDLSAAVGAGTDILHGALMEAGGQVAGKYFVEPVAQWVGGKLSNAGKGLYQSTMKPSTAAPASKIEKAIKTGIEGKYWLTDKGLEKLKTDREALALKLGKVVDKMTAKGKSVNVDDVAASVAKLKDEYKGIDAAEAHAEIDARIESLYERVQQSGRITAKEAHEIKQGIYKDLGEKAYGTMKASAKEADKQIARHINEQLQTALPEYGRINEELAEKINLTKYLERAVKRIRNHNKVSLSDISLMAGSLTGGTIHGGPVEGAGMMMATYLTKRVLDDPGVKSRLAYALYKSAKMTGKSLSRPLTYETGTQTDDKGKNVLGEKVDNIIGSMVPAFNTPW